MSKSARTKAMQIPKSVKYKVWERDNHRCLNCYKYVPVDCACCHFVARSQGGLGIEQNILTLCPDCHRIFDNSDQRQTLKPIFETYLKSKYEDWNINDLIYKK